MELVKLKKIIKRYFYYQQGINSRMLEKEFLETYHNCKSLSFIFEKYRTSMLDCFVLYLLDIMVAYYPDMDIKDIYRIEFSYDFVASNRSGVNVGNDKYRIAVYSKYGIISLNSKGILSLNIEKFDKELTQDLRFQEVVKDMYGRIIIFKGDETRKISFNETLSNLNYKLNYTFQIDEETMNMNTISSSIIQDCFCYLTDDLNIIIFYHKGEGKYKKHKIKFHSDSKKWYKVAKDEIKKIREEDNK